MRNSVVVDTNVIVRYLVGDQEEHFTKACAFWARVRSGEERAFIPESVLAETVYVLLKIYAVPRPEIADKLLRLLDYRGVVGEIKVYREALKIFVRRKIDLVDAIVLAWAKNKGLQVFSFDHDVLA